MSVVYWAELQGAGRRLGRLADRGAFDTGTHYFAGDIVTRSGTTYVALAERPPGGPTPGSAPDTWGALSDVFGNVPLPAPAPVPHLTPGVPRLQGPYVVDYTDIPHDGDRKTLWTAAAGDIVVWAGLDSSTLTNWDQGQVNVDQTGSNDILSLTSGGSNFTIPPVLLTAGNITASWHTAGSEASMGHVEVYVLVARAIAP